MKGDPKVMAGLQEAINLEASLDLQYQLDALDADRFGLSIADDLMKRHEQCEEFSEALVSRLLFLEGAPVVAPQPAKTHDAISGMISDYIARETAIVQRYAELCKECYEAGDMDNFHFYQHLAKWHRQGGNDYKGHLSWWQKQQWKVAKLGEADYIATKV